MTLPEFGRGIVEVMARLSGEVRWRGEMRPRLKRRLGFTVGLIYVAS